MINTLAAKSVKKSQGKANLGTVNGPRLPSSTICVPKELSTARIGPSPKPRLNARPRRCSATPRARISHSKTLTIPMHAPMSVARTTKDVASQSEWGCSRPRATIKPAAALSAYDVTSTGLSIHTLQKYQVSKTNSGAVVHT